MRVLFIPHHSGMEMFTDDCTSDHVTSANTVIAPSSLLFVVITHNLKCLSTNKQEHMPNFFTWHIIVN